MRLTGEMQKKKKKGGEWGRLFNMLILTQKIFFLQQKEKKVLIWGF